MAAGMVKTPEESAHTSGEGSFGALSRTGDSGRHINQPSDRTRRDTTPEDESFRLVRIQDRRDAGGSSRVGDTGYDAAGQRAGMSAHISLASYGPSHKKCNVVS
ncbi:MAG: hypothetical protein FJ267_18855 [Planctomycetes bacterium]|nr:hypothetical protein [Planctomycetota bacterium]